MTTQTDNINPSHYKQYPVEAIEIIEEMNSPLLANCMKYCWRMGDKGGEEKREEDRNKALWYFDRWVDKHSDKYRNRFVEDRQHTSAINYLVKLGYDGGIELAINELEALDYVDKRLSTDHSYQAQRVHALKNHMVENKRRVVQRLLLVDSNLRVDLDTGDWIASVTPGVELLKSIRKMIEDL